MVFQIYSTLFITIFLQIPVHTVEDVQDVDDDDEMVTGQNHANQGRETTQVEYARS